MSKTKIVLSTKELEMVNDTGWILTKQRIIQQVSALLDSVIPDLDALLLSRWETLCDRLLTPPRIFKGENYLGLPYVTLDHPRLFAEGDILTVRTMFWWGKFMSVTLHAGGIYKDVLLEKILNNISKDDAALHICIHENQWHHYFESDNYVSIKKLTQEDLNIIKTKRKFVKIAFKLSLEDFNEMKPMLIKHYRMFAEILA